MFPNQQDQNGGLPNNNLNSPPQQLNGQYQVVPTPQPVQNVSHSGHNPYEFIVNPNTPKASNGFLNGANPLKTVALLGGGLIILVVLVIAVGSALKPKGLTPALIGIAQRQQEIIRISKEAEKLTQSPDATNFVTSVYTSISSDQVKTISYLSANGGGKIKSTVLAADVDTKTDTLLANATSANNYDSAVAQNLESQLQTYTTLLKDASSQASGQKGKALLQQSYANAANFYKQAAKIVAESNS